MKKISFLFILNLCFLSGCSSIKTFSNFEYPNFILILADDQGWNGTSVQMMDNQPLSKSDYHQTPNLEILASNGMRFSSAYASAPVCSPSRYSIQFGQTPARLQMIRVGMNTSHINHKTEYTIPKLLRKVNPLYKTAHFGKWGIDAHPSELGYDESDGITRNKDGGFNHMNNKKQWQNNISDDPKKIFSITERAISFIEEQANNKTPFFMQISHYAVHSDLMMRKESLIKYKNKSKGIYQKNAGFAAMTEDLDFGVGMIINKLKSLGLNKNTYIIYTSDNGAVPVMPPRPKYKESSNFPLSRGKWDAFEGGIRVPFIISGPGIEKSSQSTTPISFSDILPTIVDLAGYNGNWNGKIDGGSFKNILKNKTEKIIQRSINGLVFHVPYENGIALKRAHSSIIIGQFKLIKFHDNNDILLFDLKNDIQEKNNLLISMPLKARFLEKTLNNYLSRVKAPKWKPGITWKSNSLKNINSYH